MRFSSLPKCVCPPYPVNHVGKSSAYPIKDVTMLFGLLLRPKFFLLREMTVRIAFKLPLQIDPFCPCLCCFLASHRGHYPTLSLFGSYIRSFSHFPCHFMIESWGWSLSTLSWSDFLKSRVFQNSLYLA